MSDTVLKPIYIARPIWDFAIAVQSVDGNVPTEQFLADIKANYKEKFGTEHLEKALEAYHFGLEDESHSREADFVTMRSAQLLAEPDVFKDPFSMEALAEIHRILYSDIMPSPGVFRHSNIMRSDAHLQGDRIEYVDGDKVEDEIKRCISLYKGASQKEDFVGSVAKIIIDFWKIHPFRKGNTQALMVFFVKCALSYGFSDALFSWMSRCMDYFYMLMIRACHDDEGVRLLEEFLEDIFQSGDDADFNPYRYSAVKLWIS